MRHTGGSHTGDLSQFLSPDNTLAILRNPFGNLKGFITCMIGTRLPVHMSVRSTREFRKWDFAHSQASHFVRRRRDYRNHNAWEILKEHGYSVVLYHCPLAALRCDLTIFDLAILDFQMPGLNGCELFLHQELSSRCFCSQGEQMSSRTKTALYFLDASTRLRLFGNSSKRSQSLDAKASS